MCDNPMLDDVDRIKQIDTSGMLNTVASFPEQIKEAVEMAEKQVLLDPCDAPKIKNCVVTGMGGSAISGDLLNGWLRNNLKKPLAVNREYSLPRWGDENTLTVFISYSGNTEETLSSFEDAQEKECKTIGISSGGKLEEYCKEKQVPHVKIKTGFQPREALAYLFFPTLIALKKMGFIDMKINSSITTAVTATSRLVNSVKKDVPTKENIAKKIAEKMNGTIPQVYGFGAYAAVAQRWRTQFNENSKLIAREDRVSECNHNDIVGWSANHEASKMFSCVLLRDQAYETDKIRKRFEFMKSLYQEKAHSTVEVNAQGETLLARMLYSLLLGDFISIYAAVLREIDPTPVEIISELKKELAVNKK